jgi:3-deoxy-7-phosphoheptulonate synthase
MLILLARGASDAAVSDLLTRLRMLGLSVHHVAHDGQVRIAAVGDPGGIDWNEIKSRSGVESVTPLPHAFKLGSRAFRPATTVIPIGKVTIGGDRLSVMAGPCSVEGEEQTFRIAEAVAKAGATILRGGAYKPRTSPYAFQGLKEQGLKYLAEARKRTGLPVVTEVLETESAELVAEYSDILQVGARNIQNFTLLRRVGEVGKPVLLKRGMATTIQEFLLSAEYILAAGNPRVILCERGIRTFETSTRFTLDLNAVPVLKKLSHLPVVVDPSHGTGHWDLVAPMAKGAVACGADGLIIEVHPRPEEALSDGPQSLKPSKFAQLMRELRPVAEAVGRSL